MSHISIVKRTMGAARAGVIFVGMLSPAHAAYQHDLVRVFPDLPISTSANHRPELTAQLPWLAPVGHRQPHQADVPSHKDVSAWEREQQQADQHLDRKLMICRGC